MQLSHEYSSADDSTPFRNGRPAQYAGISGYRYHRPQAIGEDDFGPGTWRGPSVCQLGKPGRPPLCRRRPRGFLSQFPDGAVLDEIQRCPPLFSNLLGILDADRRMGRFILTGSQQFGMIEAITQSLAGRVSLLSLWPFSLSELQDADRAPASLDTLLHAGLFPPIHDRPVNPDAWLQSYVATYLERDVRMSINVQDLSSFQLFLQLCAGRIGQLVNISSPHSSKNFNRQLSASEVTP